MVSTRLVYNLSLLLASSVANLYIASQSTRLEVDATALVCLAYPHVLTHIVEVERVQLFVT